MAKKPANNPAKQATKAGMNALINAGGAALGIPPGMAKPIIGAVIALAALLIGFAIAIGFMFAYFLGFLRHFNKQGGNGGNLNTLTVVSTNATIYVNLVYPSGSECTSKFGGSYILKKGSSEIACSAATAAQRSDSGFKIGVKLGSTFYEGAAAANNLDTFPGGARFSGSPSASSGTTHWLEIPGYHNAGSGTPTTMVPVVGVIANTSTTRQGPNGEDLTLRYDLIVKDRTEANTIIAAWQGSDNCKKSVADLYECAVTGVTIKFGTRSSTTTTISGERVTTTNGHQYLNVPLYDQLAYWDDMPNGNARGNFACGVTSIKMALDYYQHFNYTGLRNLDTLNNKRTYYDRYISSRSGGIGRFNPYTDHLASGVRVGSSISTNDWAALKQSIQNYHPVVVQGYFNSSSGGHIVLFVGIDNDTVTIANPLHGVIQNMSKEAARNLLTQNGNHTTSGYYGQYDVNRSGPW